MRHDTSYQRCLPCLGLQSTDTGWSWRERRPRSAGTLGCKSGGSPTRPSVGSQDQGPRHSGSDPGHPGQALFISQGSLMMGGIRSFPGPARHGINPTTTAVRHTGDFPPRHFGTTWELKMSDTACSMEERHISLTLGDIPDRKDRRETPIFDLDHPLDAPGCRARQSLPPSAWRWREPQDWNAGR